LHGPRDRQNRDLEPEAKTDRVSFGAAVRVQTASCLMLLFAASAALGDEPPTEAAKPGEESPHVQLQKPEIDDDSKEPKEDLVVTRHTAVIDGKAVEYTATAGTLPLTGEDEKPKADLFFIAYTVEADGDRPRPITFCFNGGPGSSSVWLHMGMLGPKRVKLPDEPVVPIPPTQVVANPYSLLDISDLVFIDPVSTGYSRPAEGEKKEQFHGYDEDIESVGRFIHLF